jgi:hypothetical protein
MSEIKVGQLAQHVGSNITIVGEKANKPLRGKLLSAVESAGTYAFVQIDSTHGIRSAVVTKQHTVHLEP